jgi:hypothetical protein
MANLRGRVADDRGLAVVGARVEAVREDGGAVRAETNADGVYQLRLTEGGRYRWRAEAHGHEPASGEGTAERGRKTAPGPDIVLNRLGAIAGRVAEADGAGVAGVPVAARGRAHADAPTSAGGVYRLADLPPGRYEVRVEPPADRQAPAAREVDVAAGDLTDGVDFLLLPVEQPAPPTGPAGPEVPERPPPQPTPTAAALPAPTGPAPPAPAPTPDPAEAFLAMLNLPEFSLDQPISEVEAAEAIVLFTLAATMIAGSGRVRTDGAWRKDAFGLLTLHYGLGDKSLQTRLRLPGSALSAVGDDLRALRDAVDRLESDIGVLEREARRQFNLGSNNEVLGNIRFAQLFRRYVQLAADPALALDLRAENLSPVADKAKVTQAIDRLFELKGVIVDLVRCLSRYGTIASRRTTRDWAGLAGRALVLLEQVGKARLTDDLDERTAYATLAEITGRDLDRQVLPFVVLARDGGALLRLALEIYGATKHALDDYGRDAILELFQPPANPLSRTTPMRNHAAALRRYPLASWQ